MEKTKMTEESPGVASSKRIMGIVAMGLGIFILSLAGIVSTFYPEILPNIEISIKAGAYLTGIGAALLGITVLESFSGGR